jgi:hypothetical protein
MYHEIAKNSTTSFWHKCKSSCIRSGFGENRATLYGNEDEILATAYVKNIRIVMTAYAKSSKKTYDVFCRRGVNFS